MRILIISVIIMGQLLIGKPKQKRKSKPFELTPEGRRMAEDLFLRYKLKQSEKEFGLNKRKSRLTAADIKRIREMRFKKDKP